MKKYRTDYKKGEQVRIRVWEDLEKEFGLNSEGHIKTAGPYTVGMEKILRKVPNRVLTIRSERQVQGSSSYPGDYYHMEEDNGEWCWSPKIFEESLIIIKPEVFEMIENRFEILDL